MLANKELLEADDLYSMKKKKKKKIIYKYILWTSMATSNCLVINILENIFVFKRKKIHTGLEQHVGE